MACSRPRDHSIRPPTSAHCRVACPPTTRAAQPDLPLGALVPNGLEMVVGLARRCRRWRVASGRECSRISSGGSSGGHTARDADNSEFRGGPTWAVYADASGPGVERVNGRLLVVVDVKAVPLSAQPGDDHLDVVSGAPSHLVADALRVLGELRLTHPVASLAQLVPHECPLPPPCTAPATVPTPCRDPARPCEVSRSARSCGEGEGAKLPRSGNTQEAYTGAAAPRPRRR